MAGEGLDHSQPLGWRMRIDGLAAKRELPRAHDLRRQRQHGGAILHQRLVGLAGAIPLDEGELGMMQGTALAVAERTGKFDDPRLARRQELLAGEFRRGPQIKLLPVAGRSDQVGRKGMKMGLIARRGNRRGGLDLDEVPVREEPPQSGRDAGPPQEKGPPVGVAGPERRRHGFSLGQDL
jgi:hypothetical protein